MGAYERVAAESPSLIPLTGERSMHRTRTSLPSAAALVIFFSLGLVGCGGSGGSSGAGESGLLTDEQATSVLLTQANVGDAFAEAAEDDEDDDDGGLGCLDSLESDDANDAPISVERSFDGKTDFETPSVAHSVASFETVGAAEDALERLADALEGCTEIDEVDAEGARTQLTIKTNDDTDEGLDVDDQVNVTATGEIGSQGFEFPIGLWFSATRVDNHLSVVFLVDLGTTFGEYRDDYVGVAVDRLRAVIADEQPPDTFVDASVEEGESAPDDETDDGPDATDGEDTGGFEQLALDGGTYTWSNGVSMSLSVERTELWGDLDDFCGDGSCGIANRDDTRVVLRYEVTVPDDASEPFDAYSCPGDLNVMSGNSDEALSGVAGAYDREIDGKIFPGQSKFGLAEYYIEKDYAGGEFYIESSCGDEFDGETAYFVGSLG